jgi:phenylpropionate dioxygenase-like ring-hydroxylating dioxygenase large terminal subunit
LLGVSSQLNDGTVKQQPKEGFMPKEERLSFMRNGWFVAAWPEEVSEKPLAHRLGNEPIVLYREKSGRAVALLDRCPHRGAPLSLGEVARKIFSATITEWSLATTVELAGSPRYAERHFGAVSIR